MAANPRLTFAGIALAAIGLFAGDALANRGPAAEPFKIPDAQYEPVAWSDIAPWAADDHAAAYGAFLISCRAVARRKPVSDPDTVLYNALIGVCRQAVKAGPLKGAEARAFFEKNFRPVRVLKIGDEAGFLTGYYEPIVDGSRFPSPEFPAALYRRPADLAVAGRKPGGSIPNKGKIVRVVAKDKQVEYFDRGEIEDGALDGRHLEICWLRDHITTFVIQIQGSARVRLEDGTMLRVNYDAHNGHPYTAVGRILMERGYIARHEMSMARIRNWMKHNPDEGREVRHKNRSFIFFRITGLGNDDEPAGAQGVPLTPGRSIAVDRLLHSYGTPFFIEANLPLDDERGNDKFNRLVIAQDTGSAIIGPARADIYFGSGDGPGAVAGRIRHKGQFVMLVPNEIDPVAAGRHMPLPPVKPKPPKDEAAKDKGKAKAKTKNGKTVPGTKKDEPGAKPDNNTSGATKTDAKNGGGDRTNATRSENDSDNKSKKKSEAGKTTTADQTATASAGAEPLTSLSLVGAKSAAPATETTGSVGDAASRVSIVPLPQPRAAAGQDGVQPKIVKQKDIKHKSKRHLKTRAARSSRSSRQPESQQRLRAVPRPPGAIGRP